MILWFYLIFSSPPVILVIDRACLQEIFYQAQQSYPEECCGLLLGRLVAGDRRQVEAVRAVTNAWDRVAAETLGDTTGLTRHRRYSIAPEEMLAVMREARSQQQDIIGVYHSHPDGVAAPSECDRQLAWAQYSYLIVAVQGGAVEVAVHDCRSWALDTQHQFQPEPIEISQPTPQPARM